MPWLFLAATIAAQGQQSSPLFQASPNAKLSSAARGTSFHVDSNPRAISSGRSNVICMVLRFIIPVFCHLCQCVNLRRPSSTVYLALESHGLGSLAIRDDQAAFPGNFREVEHVPKALAF